MHPSRPNQSNFAQVGITAIRTVVFCLIAIFILGSPHVLFAKSGFSVSGKVKTAKGHGFPMAIVKIDNGMGMTMSVFTKPNGRFTIPGVKPGRYEVSAEQDGYPKVSQSIVLPGAKSVKLVLREGAKWFNPGPENLHQARNTDSSTHDSGAAQ